MLSEQPLSVKQLTLSSLLQLFTRFHLLGYRTVFFFFFFFFLMRDETLLIYSLASSVIVSLKKQNKTK